MGRIYPVAIDSGCSAIYLTILECHHTNTTIYGPSPLDRNFCFPPIVEREARPDKPCPQIRTPIPMPELRVPENATMPKEMPRLFQQVPRLVFFFRQPKLISSGPSEALDNMENSSSHANVPVCSEESSCTRACIIFSCFNRQTRRLQSHTHSLTTRQHRPPRQRPSHWEHQPSHIPTAGPRPRPWF